MRKKSIAVIALVITVLTLSIILLFLLKGNDGRTGQDIEVSQDTEAGQDIEVSQDRQPAYDEQVKAISPEKTAGISDSRMDTSESDLPTEINGADDSDFSVKDVSLINEEGLTEAERILPPDGFDRVTLEEGSFCEYLRNLPLKPQGSPVRYYDGSIKPWDVHVAVIDLDVGKRDLQQCADAVMRLRAEYLYSKKLYDQIHFNFTNGFNAEYKKWMDGYRIKVTGNKAVWVKQGSSGTDYESFRKYLDVVFAYAGTLSLSKEMENIELKDIRTGDVFLKGGSPGHCVIVLDMAENPQTGEKVFLTAQSYMPAQDIHILKNPSNEGGNPWYPLDFGDELVTPEWTFSKDQVYRFTD